MLKIVKGNLLNAEEEYIIHQVNCQGIMGSGVAKSIKNKWYQAFEDYKVVCDNIKTQKLPTSNLLGYAQFPIGSGLQGLPSTGGAFTDGVVAIYTTFGSIDYLPKFQKKSKS